MWAEFVSPRFVWVFSPQQVKQKARSQPYRTRDCKILWGCVYICFCIQASAIFSYVVKVDFIFEASLQVVSLTARFFSTLHCRWTGACHTERCFFSPPASTSIVENHKNRSVEKAEFISDSVRLHSPSATDKRRWSVDVSCTGSVFNPLTSMVPLPIR